MKFMGENKYFLGNCTFYHIYNTMSLLGEKITSERRDDEAERDYLIVLSATLLQDSSFLKNMPVCCK